MSDSLLHSDHEDVASHGKRSNFGRFKRFVGGRFQPDKLSPILHSRSSSRLSHCGRSPDRKNEKADNAYSSAAPSESELDDNKDAQPSAKTARPLAKTAISNLNEGIDIWTIAEKELRKDLKKREKLEEYDRILKNRLGPKLEPIGTPKRRKQFLDFLDKEIKPLNGDSDTSVKRLKRKAGRFFKSAVSFVVATQSIINTAASPCLPAAVACAGVTVLLSLCVETANQRHILFEGLDIVSGTIRRLAEYEKLLWDEGNQQFEEPDLEVRTSMMTVCSNIIEFQARAACFLQLDYLEGAIRDVFKRDAWDQLLLAIKEAEINIRECVERKQWRNNQPKRARNETRKEGSK